MTHLRPYSIRAVRLLLLLACLLGGVRGWPQTGLEGLTFKDALNACIAAISNGDLTEAADLFSSLEQTFGSEDEYLATDAQRQLLPLKGLSELGAGRYAEAAETLSKLQNMFPDVLLQKQSLLYGLAQANRGAGNLKQARETLDQYVRQYAGTVEAGLAFLERADLFFQEGLLEEGLEALDQFYESNAPASLRMQGQLKAVRACLNDNLPEEATDRMLNTKWSITTMPELAQLAFSALQCGEYAMTLGNYSQALRLFKLVPPKNQLVRQQKEKLAGLSSRILSGRRRALLSSNRHQQTYLSTLQQQLKQQLAALEKAEDYTPKFYLHYGQCLLLDGKFHRAWLVFEYLSLNESLPQEVREEAHYRWVVCAHQLANWEEALTIARNFVDRYPDSKLAPQALYLIAKAHLEQRRYRESIEVLTDLINKFPDHPLYGRWVFTRGFNQVVLESYKNAREDFGLYTGTFPEGQLVINARLWNAITFFFEKSYSTCIEELTELLELDFRHPLYPEILYRLASAHYADRGYDSALKVIDSFLAKFERHQRVHEALVLKGDIAMGKGELDIALNSFNRVSTESPDMYLYSLFQSGKIFRALENYEGMVSHFQAFLENPEAPRIRISEALYWLGWAHQQMDRIDLAFPVFEEALKLYGNDTESSETTSILQALEKLKRNQTTLPESQSPLVTADSFSAWLTDEVVRAEKEKKYTYLSRLVLFYNQKYTKEAATTFPLVQLAETVPLEAMDPEALGLVGLELVDQKSPRAETYLNYLVETYSRSNARAMAFLGLAEIAYGRGDYVGSRSWLEKSDQQVPVHPHMNDTRLLLGEVLSQLGEFGPAIDTFENLLRIKSARGRPHAKALQGIAKAYREEGSADKAIAYYQRIYNMYRAYPDLVSNAYWASAQLFEFLGKIPEAVDTLNEMLKQNKLSEYNEWSQAEEKLQSLLPLLPKQSVIENSTTEGPTNE